MTTRTDISPPLSRIAIAIADYLIPLTADQRDDVIVRAMCLVDDPEDRQIPYRVTDPQHVSACDDVPHEDPAPVRPTRSRVSATRAAASSEIEATERSIVEVLSSHPEGMTHGQLATALNFETTSGRFVAALRHVVTSGRVRAQATPTVAGTSRPRKELDNGQAEGLKEQKAAHDRDHGRRRCHVEARHVTGAG